MIRILRLFLVFVASLSFTTASYSTAGELSGCREKLPKLTLDTSSENNFDFGKPNDVVLLEVTCSQLKSGACGTGICEKGWKCIDTGIKCLCSPPQ